MEKILTILFRRKYHILVFAGFMVFFPMAFAYLQPKEFEASAKILLRPGSYKKPFEPTMRGAGLAFTEVTMIDVENEKKIILSRPIIEKVVIAEGLEKEFDREKAEAPSRDETLKYLVYRIFQGVDRLFEFLDFKTAPASPHEAAISALSSGLTVESQRLSNIIEIKWESKSPELSQDVVNGIVDAYLEFHIELYGHTQAIDMIKKTMDESYEKLIVLEDEWMAYKLSNDISDIATERHDLLNRLSESRMKSWMSETLNQKDFEFADWSDIAGDTTFFDLRTRLTQYLLDRIDLVNRLGTEDQRVFAIDKAISEVKELMRRRLEVFVASSENVAEKILKRLVTLAEAETQSTRKLRDIEGLDDQYKLIREKYLELTLSKALDPVEFASPRVVNYAVLPDIPKSISKLGLLVVCLVLGVIGGVSYAFAYDRLVNRVCSEEEIEALVNLPVQATIPRYRWWVRRRPELLARSISWDFIPLRSILESPGDDSKKSLLLLPSCRGAGSSFLSGPLGDFLATNSNRSVVCVSFKFSRKLRTIEGKKEHSLRRIIEALPDLNEFIRNDPHRRCSRLDIIVLPEEVDLGQKAIVRLLEALKNQHDYVLVNIGTHRSGTFYYAFIPLVDDVLIIVCYDKTNRAALNHWVNKLKEYEGRISGCILNKSVHEIPGFLRKRIFNIQ